MKRILYFSIFLVTTIRVNAQSVHELSFYAPLPSVFDIAYSNDHLFIAQNGLIVLDVSDPYNPALAGQATYPGNFAYNIAVNGNKVYMVNGGGGYFAVYDVSLPSAPSMMGSLAVPATAFMTGGDIVVEGDFVYWVAGDSLYIVDASVPSVPQLVNVMGLGSMAISIQVVNNTLFLATATEIQIYTLIVPDSPAFVSSVNTVSAYPGEIAVDPFNDRLFMHKSNALLTHMGFDAFDFSTITSPVYSYSDSIPLNSQGNGEIVYSNNIVIIESGGSIRLFDVTNNSSTYLTFFSGQNVANSIVALDINDSVIYVGKGSGIEILAYSGLQTSASVIEKDHFNIYPTVLSPGQSIHFQEPSVAKLYDVRGKIITENLFANKELSLPVHLQAGVYFLKLLNKNNSISRKIVVR